MIRWESGSFISMMTAIRGVRPRAKALSERSERGRPVTICTLLFTALGLGMLFAPAAIAGAATGMPSPFLPPYPDFGFCAPCPAGCRCAPIVLGHVFAHQRVPVRPAGKGRKWEGR